ncbi:MAG TPA: hypothetical protein VF624_13955 [Tepidisphaeraceae bacterium]|jgi:prepilin-type processing-associated H-X9-DG protein
MADQQLSKPFRGIFLKASGVVLALAIGLALLLPQLDRAREPANRIKCASRLRQLSHLLTAYTAAHESQYPPDLQTLAKWTVDSGNPTEVLPNGFTCASAYSDDARSIEPTHQISDLFTSPSRHVTYVYVGNGLTDDKTRESVVIAYDEFHNHSHAGINVLFADGHIEWIDLGRDSAMNVVGRSLAEQTSQHTRPVILK